MKEKENTLTEKQENIYYQIKEFINKNGYSPTIRELCDLCYLNSTATMYVHLQNLVEKGYITYVKGVARTIRITKEIK